MKLRAGVFAAALLVTGFGAPLTQPIGRHPASEARASLWGVLRLTLGSTRYEWAFIPVSGGAIADSGGGQCR